MKFKEWAKKVKQEIQNSTDLTEEEKRVESIDVMRTASFAFYKERFEKGDTPAEAYYQGLMNRSR